jgi:integral membrane protein
MPAGDLGRADEPGATRRAVLRFRVLANLVGVALAVLVGAGVPLQYAAGHPGVVEVLGPLHGTLYIVYLLAAGDLARRRRWRVRLLLIAAVAGLLPGLMFAVERRLARVKPSVGRF